MNPVQAQFTAQLHHLDLDFYRKFQVTLPGDEEPFVVNRQIKAHFQQWHKGEPDPYANGDSSLASGGAGLPQALAPPAPSER